VILRPLAWHCIFLGAIGLFVLSPPADFAPPATRGAAVDTIDHPPPPGTAQVRGSVHSCDDATPPQQCTIQIKTVEAYGVNTPPIAPGSRRVQVRPIVLENHALDSLCIGGPWQMTLVHAGPQMKTPGRETDPSSAWTLTRVEGGSGNR
jgi:hypothetical protein